MNGVQLRLAGVAARSSIGMGEQYHEPLRRIHHQIQLNHRTISPLYIPRVTMKAINVTMGDTCLVSSTLVFGVLSQFSIISADLPNHKERMQAIKTAQAEMNSIFGKRKVFETPTKNIPPPADETYKFGQEML